MPALDVIPHQYSYKLSARKILQAEANAAVNTKMEAITREFDALVARAKNEGTSIAAIARAMNTSTTVVYECLKRAETFEPALAQFDPLGERYAWEGDKIRVTLTRDEIRALADNWNEKIPADAPNSALFANPIGRGWMMVDERWLGTYTHPLSRWESAENLAELSEWASERAN